MPYSPKAASTPTYTTPNLNIEKSICIKKRSKRSVFLCKIPCHRRHSIGARRYSMPPTALKINLATTLRVFFFYICSRLTASSRTLSVHGGIPCHRRHSKITLRQRYAFCFLYMLAHDCKQSRGIYKKTTLRFSQGCFFVWCRRSDSNRHG